MPTPGVPPDGPGAPPTAARPSSADSVTWGVRVAASWSWRILVVVGVLAVLAQVVSRLSEVVIPVGLSLLLAALLTPAVAWAQRKGVPRGIATAGVLVGGIAALGAVLTFVVQAFVNGLPDLTAQVSASVTSVRGWLVNGPLNLRQTQIDSAFTSFTNSLGANRSAITAGALSTATTLSQVLSGLAIALFTTIFFVYDGAGIWRFVLRAVPGRARGRVDVAGQRGFASLVGYVRATVAVAGVDAVGIGIGLAVLQVPLALPLAALVFLGAFVPIIGAFLTGFIAVLVALVTKGYVVALIVLGVVVGVQQLEAHVLQPLLLGRAVALHPLAVVLGIAVGLVVAGVIGALLVVPIIAIANAAVRSLFADEQPSSTAEVDATDPDDAMPKADDRQDGEPPAAVVDPRRGAPA
jgi:predicted PurR-regulated permease PerM